jgi:DNA-binding CsgD family transcriptional regulator
MDSTEAFLEANPVVDRALAKAFDAVLEPALWSDATETLAQALSGQAFCVHYQGAGDGAGRLKLPASSRYRDLLVEFLRDGWAEHDLRAKRGWPLVRAGRPVVVEDDVSTPEERAHSAIYQDLFAKHDLTLFAGVGFHADDRIWAATIIRSAKQGRFQPHEIELLAGARPHIARLVTYASRMADAALVGALSALESAGKPALLLDRRGRAKMINAPALALLGHGLLLRNGQLLSDDPTAAARLEAMAKPPTGKRKSHNAPLLAPLCIHREGRPPLILEALPARGALAEAIGGDNTLVLITDLAEKTAADDTLLRETFGFTRREAHVANMLAGGRSIVEIAAHTGLKPSSVRQVVKALLTKAQVHRQTDLVAMLARIGRPTER